MVTGDSMKRLFVLLALGAGVLLVVAGCEASSGDKDASPVDTVTPDTPDTVSPDVTDTAAPDVTDTASPDIADTAAPDIADTAAPDVTDTGAPDVTPDPGPQDQGGDVADYGFDVRVPEMHTYTCEGGWQGSTEMSEQDADWICTFDVGDVHGYVYTQSTPTGCIVTMSANPTYTGAGGWISIDGQVSPLTNVGYDWGGNHHNDSMSFDWNGKHYSYYHSSFGWGWRACQNVDCIQVYGGDGTTLETDGCSADRTLPAVCSAVKADGTYDPLVDTFAKCPGDPNG